jgi:hypothetical protein
LLFDGKNIKNIRKEKGMVKKKIALKASGQRMSSEENGTMQGWPLRIAC